MASSRSRDLGSVVGPPFNVPRPPICAPHQTTERERERLSIDVAVMELVVVVAHGGGGFVSVNLWGWSRPYEFFAVVVLECRDADGGQVRCGSRVAVGVITALWTLRVVLIPVSLSRWWVPRCRDGRDDKVNAGWWWRMVVGGGCGSKFSQLLLERVCTSQPLDHVDLT